MNVRKFAGWWLAIVMLSAVPLSGQEPPASRWEDAMQAFERQDRKSPPAQQANVFVGSSSIRMWKLQDAFPGHDCVNRGFGGSEMADAAQYVKRIVLPLKPRVIVLYSGDNDLSKNKTPEDVLAAYQDFARQVREQSAETKLVVLALKPSPRRFSLADKYRAANRLLEAAVKTDPHAVFIDVWSPMLGEEGFPRPELYMADQLHLTPAGYRVWNQLVEPHLAPRAP
ncbi:GDSL-type esterase/lipase family protein [Planctellipticum variicoloris]|uniref:GDSL-type esterase/lipase family protein n=1 Tax=Planctellipticum variicoloris TaxID=3064265 RepID=UPI00301383E8|nr:GDSL-type esterase/lipase family protein [Planctomycetaceae bacterium SH412]